MTEELRNLPGRLTSEEVMAAAEMRRRDAIVEREMWQSRLFSVGWVIVGLMIWIPILLYLAKAFYEGMWAFLRNL